MSADKQTEMPRTVEAAFGVSHPLPTGAFVAVFDLPSSGPPFIEGNGLIRGQDRAPHHYRVQFVGEPRTRLRFVHPDWQSDPDRALVLLDAFWRSRRSGEPLIEEFFPDKDS